MRRLAGNAVTRLPVRPGAPWLLDAYCGGGGASQGYYDAGYNVLGVDIRPQPGYRHLFVQADALAALATWDLSVFAAVHASPPCHDHSGMTNFTGLDGSGSLLAATRQVLQDRVAVPWIIENVEHAPMRPDYILDGCMFGLGGIVDTPAGPRRIRLARTRWFETSWRGFALLPGYDRRGIAISVTGHGSTSTSRARLGRAVRKSDYQLLLGIDWLGRDQMAQAIPPAYTRWIAEQLAAL